MRCEAKFFKLVDDDWWFNELLFKLLFKLNDDNEDVFEFFTKFVVGLLVFINFIILSWLFKKWYPFSIYR